MGTFLPTRSLFLFIGDIPTPKIFPIGHIHDPRFFRSGTFLPPQNLARFREVCPLSLASDLHPFVGVGTQFYYSLGEAVQYSRYLVVIHDGDLLHPHTVGFES